MTFIGQINWLQVYMSSPILLPLGPFSKCRGRPPPSSSGDCTGSSNDSFLSCLNSICVMVRGGQVCGGLKCLSGHAASHYMPAQAYTVTVNRRVMEVSDWWLWKEHFLYDNRILFMPLCKSLYFFVNEGRWCCCFLVNTEVQGQEVTFLM